nr:DUF5691 domain-containing protein [Deinobacterium chartae]
MLEGERGRLLPELISAAAARGLRLPASLLPELLARPDLRTLPELSAAAGARGAWLAADLVQGETLEDGELLSRWEHGDLALRTRTLSELRRRDPGRARELLEADWAGEPAANRAELLGVLREGLGPEDEAFLEAALADRGKTVRQGAAQLLAALPGSALIERHWARAREWVVFVRKPPSALERARALARGRDPLPRLEVTPPGTCDADMQRDGVLPKPPSGRGERAWWLEQTLAFIPPDRWTRDSGLDPAELVALFAQEKEWRAPLLEGLALAARRSENPAWAALLLEAPEISAPTRRALAAALPPDDLEAALLSSLNDKDALEEGSRSLLLLDALRVPLREATARAVLEGLARRISRGRNRNAWSEVWNWTERLGDLALRCPPAAAEGISWPEHLNVWSQWERPIAIFSETLRYRRAMLEELV